MTNKSLGRGLSAFLGENIPEISKNSIEQISVGAIEANPFQPRQVFDNEQLQALAESIKSKGVLQPILLKKLSDGSYQLIAGERRFRASKIAGLTEIPAIILNITEKEQLEIAILENIQRENLNPIEEAESYKRLMQEFSYTQENLSKILGKSRSHIANMLRLLTLPEKIKNYLSNGQISFGHARALVGQGDPEKIAQMIIDQSLSVRETEDIVRNRKNVSKITKAMMEPSVSPEIYNISSQLTSLLGLNSKIKLKKNGGLIEIEFSNFEELDSIIAKFSKLNSKE